VSHDDVYQAIVIDPERFNGLKYKIKAMKNNDPLISSNPEAATQTIDKYFSDFKFGCLNYDLNYDQSNPLDATIMNWIDSGTTLFFIIHDGLNHYFLIRTEIPPKEKNRITMVVLDPLDNKSGSSTSAHREACHYILEFKKYLFQQ
jgi:hypothetical protein